MHTPSKYLKGNTTLCCAIKKYGIENFLQRSDVYNMILGGKRSATTSKPIYQFDEFGNLIKKWDSFVDAAKTLNISKSAIFYANRCKTFTANFYWSTNDSINICEFSKLSIKPCYKYNVNGKLVAKFISIAEAAKEVNATANHIKNAIDCGGIYHNHYSLNLYEDGFMGIKRPKITNSIIYVYDLEGKFICEVMPEDVFNFFGIKQRQSLINALIRDGIYKGYQISLSKQEYLPQKKNQMPVLNVKSYVMI